MSADTPQGGLRLLATLIAADLRAGSPALGESAEVRDETPRRGRRPVQVVVVASHRLTARAA